MQVEEQPSPLFILPSSHPYSTVRIPSPQIFVQIRLLAKVYPVIQESQARLLLFFKWQVEHNVDIRVQSAEQEMLLTMVVRLLQDEQSLALMQFKHPRLQT